MPERWGPLIAKVRDRYGGAVTYLGTTDTTHRRGPEHWPEVAPEDVDYLLDAGPLAPNPSTVVDVTGEEPVIIRYGAGDPTLFGG